MSGSEPLYAVRDFLNPNPRSSLFVKAVIGPWGLEDCLSYHFEVGDCDEEQGITLGFVSWGDKDDEVRFANHMSTVESLIGHLKVYVNEASKAYETAEQRKAEND